MAKRTLKTKKVLSGVKTAYRAWKDWDEGDVLQGKLIGTSKNRKNKSKVDWIVEVEDAQFTDKKAAKKLVGEKLTLNCAGQLDRGMEQLSIGDFFQVTYNGQVEMKGGDYAGEMAHTMEVVEMTDGDEDEDLDDEETDEDDEDSDDDDEESEDEDDEEEEDDL